jgi:hypothetical protein
MGDLHLHCSVNQRLANAAASSTCGSTVARPTSTTFKENVAVIPSAVGANSMRFSWASRRKVSRAK